MSNSHGACRRCARHQLAIAKAAITARKQCLHLMLWRPETLPAWTDGVWRGFIREHRPAASVTTVQPAAPPHRAGALVERRKSPRGRRARRSISGEAKPGKYAS